MFGMPAKQAVTLTLSAARQIVGLMAKQGSEGLRIGVNNGSCASMEPVFTIAAE